MDIPSEKPMKTTHSVKQDLLDYFGALGAPPGHRFSIRDFNQHVMMNVFAPEERQGLDLALREFIEAQVLEQVSETEYVLAPQGLSLVSELRRTALPRKARPTPGRPPTTPRSQDTRSL